MHIHTHIHTYTHTYTHTHTFKHTHTHTHTHTHRYDHEITQSGIGLLLLLNFLINIVQVSFEFLGLF